MKNVLYDLLERNQNNAVFFDMDGVIAVYEHEAYKWGPFGAKPLFAMQEMHYFLNVDRDERAYHMLKICCSAGVPTYLLSKADPSLPWVREDKLLWAKHFVPEIPEDHIIIADSDKAETIMVKHQISELKPNMILIDDFNANLQDWRSAGGTAVKYLNGLNSKDSWNGYWVDRLQIPVPGTLYA